MYKATYEQIFVENVPQTYFFASITGQISHSFCLAVVDMLDCYCINFVYFYHECHSDIILVTTVMFLSFQSF